MLLKLVIIQSNPSMNVMTNYNKREILLSRKMSDKNQHLYFLSSISIRMK